MTNTNTDQFTEYTFYGFIRLTLSKRKFYLNIIVERLYYIL